MANVNQYSLKISTKSVNESILAVRCYVLTTELSTQGSLLQKLQHQQWSECQQSCNDVVMSHEVWENLWSRKIVTRLFRLIGMLIINGWKDVFHRHIGYDKFIKYWRMQNPSHLQFTSWCLCRSLLLQLIYILHTYWIHHEIMFWKTNNWKSFMCAMLNPEYWRLLEGFISFDYSCIGVFLYNAVLELMQKYITDNRSRNVKSIIEESRSLRCPPVNKKEKKVSS